MKKKKENKKYDPWFVNTLLPIILSALVGLSLAAVILFEPLFVNPCFRLWLSNANTSNIVISLVPAIITTISISLQIHDDSVFEVKIRDYQRIRTNMHFDLLHMVLVSVVCFVFELFASVLYRPFAGLVLALVAGAYSLLFAVLELPILMKNERTILKILKNYWLKNVTNKTQFKEEVFDDAIKNYVTTRGVKEAFKLFRSKKISDDSTLFMLLSRQNEFLIKCEEKVDCYKTNNFMGVGDTNLTTILPNVYNSIGDLCNLNDEFNYSVFDKNGQDVYLLANLCYLTKNLSQKAGYSQEKTIDRFKRIFWNYHWVFDKTKNAGFIDNLIATMVNWNLTDNKEGNLWFFKAFRDNDYPSLIYEFEKEPLMYVLMMLSCFVFNSVHVGKEVKDRIDRFMDEKTGGLNSDGTPLRKKIADSIDRSFNGDNIDVHFAGLKRFIDIGMNMRQNAFDIYPSGLKFVTVDDSVHFSVNLIIKYWFEILLFHEYVVCDSDDVYERLNKLPENHKEAINRAIEERLLKDGQTIDQNIKTPFFDFVFKGVSRKSSSPNIAIVNALIHFKNEMNTKKYNEIHKSIDDQVLIDIKAKEDQMICEIISAFKTGQNLDKNSFIEYSSTIRLEGESDELIDLLGVSLKQLPHTINSIISSLIKESSIPCIACDDRRYTKEEVEDILELKPEIAKDLWRLKLSCDPNQLERLESFNPKTEAYLPRRSFAKRRAISFEVQYNKLASMPRKATDREVNEIIDNEYIPVNGLYSFSRYKGTKTDSFLVTREDLFEKISDRIVFVPVVIRVAVNVNKDEIIVFEDE